MDIKDVAFKAASRPPGRLQGLVPYKELKPTGSRLAAKDGGPTLIASFR
jgi:hypothetical protein